MQFIKLLIKERRKMENEYSILKGNVVNGELEVLVREGKTRRVVEKIAS